MKYLNPFLTTILIILSSLNKAKASSAEIVLISNKASLTIKKIYRNVMNKKKLVLVMN